MAFSYPYADRTDLVSYGLPATALGAVTTGQQDGALASAAAFIDSKIRNRYPLPLDAWGVELVECCAVLAAERCMDVRGWNPANANDSTLVARAEKWRTWLDQVQRGTAHPDVTPASSTSVSYVSPKVITSSVIGTNCSATGTTRGW
jgi:phage gp36-like protein